MKKFIIISFLILTTFIIGGKANAESLIFGSQLNNYNPVRTEVSDRVDYNPEEIIVKFKLDISDAEAGRIGGFYQTEILEKNEMGFYKMGISENYHPKLNYHPELDCHPELVSGSIQSNQILNRFRNKFGMTEGEAGMTEEKAGMTEGDISECRLQKESIDVSLLIQNLRQDPRIEYAEPNYIAEAQSFPNDPYYKYQWNFKNINIENAWEISQGAGAVVAIVDTGVAYENYGKYKQAPDLAGTSFVSGYDFIGNDNHPNDENGHGTHIAGTIAQTTNNNLGTAGIAPKASIMPIKVLDKNGRGNYFDIAQGIYWAADNGADVINLSLGGSSSSRYLKDACAYAYSKGVTIVAASGNDSKNKVIYPARYNDYVIAVGAVRFDGAKSYYSNTGSGLDIMAPGGDLKVDQNNDGYGDGILQQAIKNTLRRQKFEYYFFQGTSMACAHISGAAALLTSQGINTPQKIREALEKTAEDKGSFGWDKKYGWGIVDIFKALNYNNESDPPEEEPEEPEEEEEEIEQTIDQMEAEGFTIDRRKNSKDNFSSRERVYGLVNVEFEGEPINNAGIKFQIKNGNGKIIEEKNGQTNSKGEYKKYFGRFKEKGDYAVLVEVEKEGYEMVELEIGFKVE